MSDDAPTAPTVEGYERLALIGHGGTAAVFSAIRTEDGAPAAIKVFDAGESKAADRQVAAMERLRGVDGVLRIDQDGTLADGRRFLVTPYCVTGSLSARMTRFGGLAPTEVAGLGAGLAAALEASHEAGVLHCDIKPSNVLFGSDDAPLLSDFGAAKITDIATASDTMAVTVLYAAPEVLEGDPATERSDVYSLGATLLAASLGHHPMRGDSDPAIGTVIARICGEGMPDPVALGLPPGLAAVLATATARDANDRYRDAARLADALRQVADAPEQIPEGTTTRRARPATRRRRVLLGTVAVALAIAVGAGTWALLRDDEPAPTEFGAPVTEANGVLGPLYQQAYATYVGKLSDDACEQHPHLVELSIHPGPEDQAKKVATPWEAVQGEGQGTFISYMPCDTGTGEARYFLGATGNWFVFAAEVDEDQYEVISKRMRTNETSPSPDFTVDEDVLVTLQDPSVYKGWTIIDQPAE